MRSITYFALSYLRILSIALLLFLIVAIVSTKTVAQVKLLGKPKGMFQGVVGTDGKPIYLLEGKPLTYDNGICGYLNYLLKSISGQATSGNTGVLRDNFSIQVCHFTQSPKTVTDVLQECETVNLQIAKDKRGQIINNRFEQPLVISGLSGTLGINGNQIPYLMLSGSKSGDVNVSGDTIVSEVQIMKSKYNKVEVSGNVFRKDTARIDVMNSSIQNLFFEGNNAKVLNAYFMEDTLGMANFSANYIADVNVNHKINEVNFFHCQLNNWLMTDITKLPGSRSIRFNQCSFGKESGLLGISADTIEFKSCVHIEHGMFLQGIDKEEPTILKFYNTDLTNIEFDYDSRYKLYESPYPELNRSIYEQLLVKFQNEKKLNSYERVDKEYFQSRHSWFVNELSFIWWDYSYNKWRIIIWTIFFLLLFTLWNYGNWEKLILIYPIKKSADISASASEYEKIIKIFVYTSFIFFSIKVDFEKLSFKSTKWLVYFFLQYIIGLICLFFIANAILKL
ncbi:MAG TPA: hypothetical protein VIM89_07915 [Mucilaginibacter sp.]